jgi:hypothetical protein
VTAEVTTPLGLSLSFGNITTNREVDMLSPLRLAVSGGFVLNGLGTGSTLSQIDLAQLGKLDRQILAKGFNSFEFQLRFQRVVEAIEASINAINDAVNANTANIAALQAISVQAQTANDAATTVSTRTSIESSYTDPTSVLTASADGTITIAAHTRRYTNGDSVSVSAGSVSGLANETRYTVYYSDAAREGGMVTYVATTNAVAQGGNTHVVGVATVPATGQPNADGQSPTAPGYIGDEGRTDQYEEIP